jgi:hypothetical protein
MNAFRVDYRAYHMDGGSVFVENVIVDAVDMLGHATIRKRLGSALVKSTCDVSELARTPGKALGKFSAIVARLASRPLLDDVAGKTDAERATMAAKTAHLTAPGPDRSNLNVAGKTDSGALTQPETATA